MEGTNQHSTADAVRKHDPTVCSLTGSSNVVGKKSHLGHVVKEVSI